jgi:3'-5' exoribonuclease
MRLSVEAIRPGRNVETILLTLDKRTQTTRAGKPYLALWLGDRTGRISARLWEDADHYAALFESGDFVRVRALAETYNGQTQLKLNDLEKVPDDQVELSDFQRTAIRDIDEMRSELHLLVENQIEKPELKRLLQALISDEPLGGLFAKAPAAKINHHAYIGGLVEHTLSMCNLAVAIGRHYQTELPGLLDTDYLIAGALLHDFGKAWELSYDRSIDYTSVGRLLGHITIGVEILTKLLDQLGIDDVEMALRLKHMILSHHGQLEYGASVLPQTPEAQVLHFIDQIDSRMNMFSEAIGSTEERWTGYVRSLGRFVFAGPPEEDATAAVAVAVVERPTDRAKATPVDAETAAEPDPDGTLDLFSEG